MLCLLQLAQAKVQASIELHTVKYQSQARKQKNTNINVFLLCIYFHPFTYIQCTNDICSIMLFN